MEQHVAPTRTHDPGPLERAQALLHPPTIATLFENRIAGGRQ